MNINKVIDYFVPAKYADDKELKRKSRFIIWFAFITNIIGIFFSIVLFLIDSIDKQNAILAFTLPVLSGIAILDFRRRGSFIFTTHFFCSFFIIAMAIMPETTGGLFSPDMPTLYILPIFALIMGNLRIGVFYSVVTIGIFLIYYFLSFSDYAHYLEQVNKLPAEYFVFNLVLNILVLLFLVFRNEILRLKLLGEIKDTNLIISQKNNEITDSINYAKRIQTAILPEPETVKNHLPHSFILYLPKDIVSGDFYWVAEKGGFQFIAVADCTGHGVPGAFMSVIGVNQLNDIILEKSITEPTTILEELNRSINKALKQNQNDINDGMDIALLKINPRDKTIDYAGAYRPLYYVRNKELTEIKATKSSIGGFDRDKEKKFASTRLQLQAGDMVYLSTDGYADQFGSEKNKKITTRNFKRMLVNICGQTLPEQEKHLLDFFNAYKAGYEQTDDVLIAGLRF